MKYVAFKYLWPPRSKTAIDFDVDKIRRLMGDAWIAQIKLKGQRNLIFMGPNGELSLWNRHKEKQKYVPPPWLIAELQEVLPKPNGKWWVFDSELLHLKDKNIKNTIYLFDVLVADGEFLIGTTQASRHKKLLEVTKTSESVELIIKRTEHIWLASNIKQELWEEAWSLTKISYVEGFVFKNTNVELESCLSSNNNSSWQVRCRKPDGNNRF